MSFREKTREELIPLCLSTPHRPRCCLPHLKVGRGMQHVPSAAPSYARGLCLLNVTTLRHHMAATVRRLASPPCWAGIVIFIWTSMAPFLPSPSVLVSYGPKNYIELPQISGHKVVETGRDKKWHLHPGNCFSPL